jgi:hypothetical protein
VTYEDISRPQLEAANLIEMPWLDLKVYPEEQLVYKNADVVLQCRDEGEKRADVVWSRADGQKLPKNAKFLHGGRLEIRGIKLHQGGIFICKAVGSEDEKGGTAFANVQVLKHS